MTTLKGVFPDPKPVRRKNFIQENVKNLRRMEQCFHTNKEVDELQKLQLQRHQKITDKYQNVTARVNTSFREKRRENNTGSTASTKVEDDQQLLRRKSSAPIFNKTASTKKTLNSSTNDIALKQKRREKKSANKTPQKLQGKVSSDPNLSHKSPKDTDERVRSQISKYRSQGIQTLDSDEIDNLYSEGMIRYPSKKNLKRNDSINKSNTEERIGRVSHGASSPSDRGDVQIYDNNGTNDSRSPELHESKDEIDFIKLNKERTSVASRMVAQLSGNNTLPTNYRKGVVPKYIRERKEAQEKEQKAKAEASHPDCPEGHVPLPDNERKETLRMLKKNYQDYVNELNKMPIRTDTLRAQRRKMEIEKQLTKLEEGIKVFSRPRVYVKVNT